MGDATVIIQQSGGAATLPSTTLPSPPGVQLSSDVPATLDGSARAGSSPLAARADHTHAVTLPEGQGGQIHVRGVVTTPIVASGSLTYDGVTFSAGDKVLLTAQALGQDNRIVVVNPLGTWAGSSDVLAPGVQVFVDEGTAGKGTTWQLTTPGTIVPGTTPLSWLGNGESVDARLRAKGDDTTDDVAALQASHAAARLVRYTKGTYKLATTGTIGGAGQTHRFRGGAAMHWDAQVATITIDGDIKAPRGQQIFQIDNVDDAHPGIVWGPNAPRRIDPAWFGATRTSDAHDDAPGLNVALALSVNGVNVDVSPPPNGRYFSLRSQVRVGRASNMQGIVLEGAVATYNAPLMKVTADLGSGVAAVQVKGVFRSGLKRISIDANGLADYCVQHVAPLGALPGWHGVTEECTFRNARVHYVIAGEVEFFATAAGNTFSVPLSHPLTVGTRVTLLPALPGCRIPTGFSRDSVYYVRQVGPTSWKLATTNSDGTIVTSTDNGTGTGTWLISVVDTGDVSASIGISNCYGNVTVAGGSTAISHRCQKADNTFAAQEINPTFQGNMQVAGAGVAALSVLDVAANTLQLDAGFIVFSGGATRAPAVDDAIVIWAENPFNTPTPDSLPAPLARSTIYWIKTISGTGPYTLTLSGEKGGTTIDITSTGSGRTLCCALAAPYYGALLEVGELDIKGGIGAGLFADVAVLPRAASNGCSLHVQMHSESYKHVHVDHAGLTITPQIGGVHVASTHFALPVYSQPDSIYWNAPLYTSLTVKGTYNGYLNVAASAKAHVHLEDPLFWAGTYQPGPTGDTTHLEGSWRSNGIPASTIAGSRTTIRVQLDNVNPPTDAISFGLEGDVGSGIPEILGSTSLLLRASTGHVRLAAPAGQPIYEDTDNHVFRSADETQRATLTYPGGVFTLTPAASMETTIGSGHYYVSVSTYWQFRGPTGKLEADSIQLNAGDGGAHGTITFPSGNVQLVAVSKLVLDSGAAQGTEIKAGGATMIKGDGSGHHALGSKTPTIAFGASVTGSRSGGTALTNLLSIADQLGLITDATTA